MGQHAIKIPNTLSQFPFKNKMQLSEYLCKSWNVFFLHQLLSHLNLEAPAHDYLTPTMTVLFHGPPTRGPVMNFCESEARGEKNLGHWLLSLPVSRVSCSPASRRESRVLSGLCNVLRHGLRSGQSEKSCTEGCVRTGTPPDQSEQCSRERVHTLAHG